MGGRVGSRGVGGRVQGGQGGCEQRIEAIVKIQKKNGGGGRGSGFGGGGGGGQGGCEWRSEVFVNIKKKIYLFIFFLVGGGSGGVRSGGGVGEGGGVVRFGEGG